MKKILPWTLTVLLATALVITNWPSCRSRVGALPPDLLQFGKDLPWREVYRKNDMVLWKIPAYGPKECRHGEEYAVTHDGRLSFVFPEEGAGVSVYHDGQEILALPVKNTMYDDMRMFYVTGEDGKTYTLVDHDGDGMIDTKSGDNREWICQHGDFSEILFTSRYERVKELLDGTRIVLEDGRWKTAASEP